MILLALALITIHADFEGGNIGRVERVSDTHVRCSVAGQVDQDGRNRQANWYYFRVDGSARREVTVDLVNLPGEYNYRPNRGAVTKDTLPVYSYDQVQSLALAPVLTLTATPDLKAMLYGDMNSQGFVYQFEQNALDSFFVISDMTCYFNPWVSHV